MLKTCTSLYISLLLVLASTSYGQGFVNVVRDAGEAPAISDCGDVSGLVGWWTATTGITEDVGVTTWADQSGEGNDFVQTTDANEPDLISSCQNSLDCVEFLASDFMSQAEFMDVEDGLTLFIVLDPKTADVNDILMSQVDGTGTGRSWASLASTDKPNTYIGGSQVIATTTALSNDTTYIVTWAFAGGSGGALDIYINGGSDETSSTATGEAASGDINIGTEKDQSPAGTQRIMEVCLYSTALGTTDREAVRDALNTKWSVY